MRQYRIINFNRAAEQALGYRAAEVIGQRAIPIFLDPASSRNARAALSAELGEPVPVGPDIFTRMPLRDGLREPRVDVRAQERLALPDQRHHHAAARRGRRASPASSASSRTSARARKWSA